MRLTGTLDQRIGRHLAAAGAGFLALVMTPAHAQAGKDRPAATIKVGEPAGFSSLTDAQSAVVDVYFGNRRLGDTQVSFLPGSISFADPAKLVALLPDIANPEAVQAALAAADLPSNSRLVCSPGTDPMLCGRLAPDIVGVIFDQEHFRVDIFVNPRMLAVRQAVVRQYLPQPEGGLSIVDAIGVVLSGSSDGPQTYNLQDHFILGDADRRLRADLAYASGFGVQADRLVLEMDKPGWRYTAGAFWAPGTDLIGRRKMLGLGIETQFDTRLDRDELQGSPLVVFLGQRSRVDIMRDGRVLTSRIYEAGNQCLETSGLPDGSYEVTLRIEDAGGAKREELRFFTKNPLIAPAGHAIYFAYAGVLANDATSEFISPTGTPFLQAGTGRRLGAHFAVDATVLTTDRTLLGEVGAYYIGKRAQIRLAAIGSSTGVYGGLLQLSSQGNSRFNFNFDLRHIRIGGHPLLSDPDPTSIVAGSLPDRNPSLLPVAISTFTQLAGNAMYNLPSAQIGVAAT